MDWDTVKTEIRTAEEQHKGENNREFMGRISSCMLKVEKLTVKNKSNESDQGAEVNKTPIPKKL